MFLRMNALTIIHNFSKKILQSEDGFVAVQAKKPLAVLTDLRSYWWIVSSAFRFNTSISKVDTHDIIRPLI